MVCSCKNTIFKTLIYSFLRSLHNNKKSIIIGKNMIRKVLISCIGGAGYTYLMDSLLLNNVKCIHAATKKCVIPIEQIKKDFCGYHTIEEFFTIVDPWKKLDSNTYIFDGHNKTFFSDHSKFLTLDLKEQIIFDDNIIVYMTFQDIPCINILDQFDDIYCLVRDFRDIYYRTNFDDLAKQFNCGFHDFTRFNSFEDIYDINVLKTLCYSYYDRVNFIRFEDIKQSSDQFNDVIKKISFKSSKTNIFSRVNSLDTSKFGRKCGKINSWEDLSREFAIFMEKKCFIYNKMFSYVNKYVTNTDIYNRYFDTFTYTNLIDEYFKSKFDYNKKHSSNDTNNLLLKFLKSIPEYDKMYPTKWHKIRALDFKLLFLDNISKFSIDYDEKLYHITKAILSNKRALYL